MFHTEDQRFEGRPDRRPAEQGATWRKTIDSCREFAAKVCGSVELQRQVLAEGLARVSGRDPTRMAGSVWYGTVQEELEAFPRCERAAADGMCGGTVAAVEHGLTLRASHAPALALQVRRGSTLLELGEVDGSANQLWLRAIMIPSPL